MNSIVFLCLVCAIVFLNTMCSAKTGISVISNYKKELNIKIQGTGVGGCDVILQPGQTDTSDCWCLWGTINYSFCAYTKTGTQGSKEDLVPSNSTVTNGRCPVITGENLVCNDLSSLGNCYDHAYECTVDSTGLCHCRTV